MRRILSVILTPLFVLAGAALLIAAPATAAPSLPAATCSYGPCGGTGGGTVSPTTSSNGVVTLQVSAGGFQSGETVNGTVHSTPVSVGSFTASGSGDVNTAITLPGGIPAGNHELILVGAVSGHTDTIPFTLTTATSGATPCAAAYTTHSSDIVLAAAYQTTACASAIPPAAVPSASGAAATPQSSSQLPFTGANVATGVAIAAIALAAGGLLVLSSRRRRRTAWEAK